MITVLPLYNSGSPQTCCFVQAVGSRPSSVLWLRAEYMKKDYGKAELMYDLLVSVENLPPTLKYE
jgi:hypothetical protein